MTITTTITVPTDYTKTVYNDFEVTQTFTIYVEPCKVTSIDATLVMTDMVYNIGSPELVSQYDFVQSPLCQYSFTKSP